MGLCWPVRVDANSNQSPLAPVLAVVSAVVAAVAEAVVVVPVPRVTVTAGPVSGETCFFLSCTISW